MKNNADTSVQWRLGDIADYEYLIASDQDEDEDVLHKRDRHIFLQWPRRANKDQTLEGSGKPSLLHFWLDQRRNELLSAEKVLLPGASVTSGLTFLKTFLVFFGLLSGFGLVKNLLQYEGNNPTNVSYYFLFVILIQIVLILLVVAVSVLRKLGSADPLRQQLSLVIELLRPVFTWFTEKAYASRLRLVPEGRRLQMLAWRDTLTSRSGLYTQAIRWHLGAIIQWFGIAFNAAAILTFFVLIVFSDRAFGWQTTIEFASDTRVYQLCRTLALPWSWLLGEGLGFPNPQQIVDSRIILHQSITDLSAEALHAWWPFLMLATVVYGLLPRVLLAVWTHRKMSTVSRNLVFNDYESDKLCRRLITPVFRETPQEQNEQQEEAVPGPITYEDQYEDGPAVIQKPSTQGQGESLILLSVDLENELNKQSLSEALTQRFGSVVQECLIFGRSGADDLLAEEVIRGKKIAYLFLIDQDWNTPIPEDLDRMQKFISAAGDQSLLAVLLTGIPTDGSPTAVDPENMHIWKQQIATLHQPRIGVQTVPALAE